MDILEKLNRRFGSWYDGLFGGSTDTTDAELRPKDILRRILAAMEDNRREGLDGQVYVPNAYTLRIAVVSDEERDYLRAFLSAEELATAVARTISQHKYRTHGDLSFVIEEADAANPGVARVQVLCRFDVAVKTQAPVSQPTPVASAPQPMTPPASPVVDDEPGTVAAVYGAAGGAILATLLVRSGDGRSLEAFPLGVSGAVVGRSRQAGNDIVLSDTQVSKRHGRISWENGVFVYRDENSTNGSRVNDSPVALGHPMPLDFGDVLHLGESTITLRPSSTKAAPVATPRFPAPAKKDAKAALVAPGGMVHRLASEMIAGRSVTADIVLPPAANVSDKHARLQTQESGRITVEDLNTPGGTFVSGERIPPLYPVALRDGDSVTFGSGAAYTVRIG